MPTYTYGKYYSSATVTTGSTTFNNLFTSSSSRLWSEAVNPLVDSLIVQQDNGGYRFGAALPTSVNISNLSNIYKLYSGSTFIITNVTFVNTSNQTYSGMVYLQFGSEFGFGLSGTTISDVKNQLANNVSTALGSTTAKECYITNISVGGKFAFGFKNTLTIAYNALYNPSNTSQLLTATIPSMNFSLTRGTTSTRSLTVNVTKTTASITATLSLRTLKNSFAISTGTTFAIVPTFLNDRKTIDYNKGKIGPTIGQIWFPLNHQSYMADDAKTIIDGIITGLTRSGTILTGNTSMNMNLIASINDDGTSITGSTHTIQKWAASGYNFYRNASHTQDITDPNHPEYAQFNASATTTLTLYPVAITQTCHETMYICLYDVEEGQISFTENGSDLINRYYVPPTDILSTQYASNIKSVHMSTLGRYIFNAEETKMTYDGQTIHPSSDYVSYFIPNYEYPKIGVFKFTSKGETLPASANGWIAYSCENNVLSNGQWYGTSVRYHLTGQNTIKYGSKRAGGSNVYYRTSILYIGVQKNNLDFIEGITDRNRVYWSDQIAGINYYEPIAYANKLSTMNDLADKLTCFHGRAAFYYLDDDAYEYLYGLKNWFLSQLWTGGCNFYSNIYASHSETTTPVRYRSITINGTVYSELNWPMRWYNYPTWTSATATSFTYYAGLVMKKPSYFSSYNGDLYIADYVSESAWNNALASTVALGSGGGGYILVYYNGLRGTITGGSWPFNVIASNTNTTWNRDRRGIGNDEIFSNGTLSLNEELHDWIYDNTGNFNDSIGQGDSGHRLIAGANDKIATNDWLYYETYE